MPLHLIPAVFGSLGPVATRSQLLERGVTVRQLARAVGDGTIVRLRRAHYALPTVDPDCATAVRLGGRLGGISAARSYGWWDGRDTALHVSWPDHGNVAKPGRPLFASPEKVTVEGRMIVRHWRILREQSTATRTCWRETPEQTLAQVLLCCDRLTAIACADSAIRTGSLTPFEVAAVFAAMPRRVRRWHRYVDGVPDSGTESIVRVWLEDRGIPYVIHPRIRDVGEVDFLVGTSLIIEVQSKAHHNGPRERHRDYLRATAAAVQGYITAHLDYAQIMYLWPHCERQILEHLARGDHHRVIR